MRKLIAKSTCAEAQIRAKKDNGAEDIEIQLFKNDLDLDSLITECKSYIFSMGLRIVNVHIYLMDRNNSVEDLEKLANTEIGSKCANIAFGLAQALSEYQSYNVGVVVHKYKAALKNPNEIKFIQEIMDKYPDVIMYINSYRGCIGKSMPF